MSIFSIESVDNEQVIIKVKENLSPLDIAKHPYISGEMAYITVTRGEKHVLTVIKKDGKTWSFHWGRGGHTLISEGTERLKKEVINYIQSQHIPYGIKGKIKHAKVFYNNNFKSWQLTLEDNQNNSDYIYNSNWHGVDDVLVDARSYCDFASVNNRVAATGINVWDLEVR